MGFDECVVGAVLNVSEDYMGRSGLTVVAESVRRGGWSVLNTENVHTAAMAVDAGSEVCYFTLKDQKDWRDFLTTHGQDGSRAIICQTADEGRDIVIHEDREAIYFMKQDEIPATYGGWAEFNVANALGAVAWHTATAFH